MFKKMMDIFTVVLVDISNLLCGGERVINKGAKKMTLRQPTEKCEK